MRPSALGAATAAHAESPSITLHEFVMARARTRFVGSVEVCIALGTTVRWTCGKMYGVYWTGLGDRCLRTEDEQNGQNR